MWTLFGVVGLVAGVVTVAAILLHLGLITTAAQSIIPWFIILLLGIVLLPALPCPCFRDREARAVSPAVAAAGQASGVAEAGSSASSQSASTASESNSSDHS